MALLNADRLRMPPLLFLMCGMDASGHRRRPGNGIGDAGAVALAKALESEQCHLQRLSLNGESMIVSCRVRCWALRLSLRLACFRSVVCVRAEWGAWAALSDADRLRVPCCF